MHFQSSKSTLDSLKSVSIYLGGNFRWTGAPELSKEKKGKLSHAIKFSYDVSVRPPEHTDWQGGTK